MLKSQSKPTATTTRWTLIVRAQGSGAEMRAALGELIAHYQQFVLWLIRRHGHPPDVSAEELKQEFLEGMLRHDDIAKLDRARGSFRGWLNAAVRNFLANQWAKWRAARAGRQGTEPLTFELLEASAPVDDLCTREFAGHVVMHALALQRDETRDKQRFDALARFLPGPQMDLVALGPLAQALGMTPTALAKAICLLRSRYRELLQQAIADLLELPPDSDPPHGPASGAAVGASQARAVEAELRELRRHFWP
jgi:DNA-directed RNA polymerase specialized sigma24 family protein